MRSPLCLRAPAWLPRVALGVDVMGTRGGGQQRGSEGVGRSCRVRVAYALLRVQTRSSTPQDVMPFLGRKRHGKFEGEVITDLRAHELRSRPPGRRVQHRMKQNWIKLDDQAGLVFLVETVILQP